MRTRITRTLAILGLVAFLLGLGTPAFPATAGDTNQAKSSAGGDFVPGQILVRFRSEVPEGRRAEIRAERSAKRLRGVAGVGAEVLEIPADMPVEQAIETFSRLPEVEYAEPNYLLHVAQTSEPWEANQWSPQKIQAPEAWTQVQNPAPVTIAIVDTGVDYRHSQLGPNMHVNTLEKDGVSGVDDDGNGRVDDIYGTDFINNDGDPMDDHFHGTHVAGIAAATRGTTTASMTGICPNCKIMAVKVLGADGSGALDVVANGIVYAADNGARVINLSLGAGLGASTLQSAVDHAWSKGSVVVAAAGNNGADLRFYPAAYANAIAVAATNSLDHRSCFSNYGNFNDPFINLSAPGEANYSTVPLDELGNDDYDTFSGTSMASPHVSGLAGLLFSQDPTRTNATVRQILESTTEDLGPAGADPFFGTGRINAYRAVTNNTSATVPPDGLYTTSATGTGYAHARKLVREAGGKLHLVWHTQDNGGYRVRHATSSDNGANWNLETDVYSGPSETFHPGVTIDGQYLYVAYPQRSSPSAYYQTFFTRKSLAGGSWSAPAALMGGTYHAVRPDLFLDPSTGRLHLVASSLDNTQYVYYRASTDQGSTWSSVRSVNPSTSTTASNTRYASVHANGKNIYIAARTLAGSLFGTTYYLHTVRSTDGGLNWFDQTKISSYATFLSGEYGVSLAGIGDRLYMGYEVASGGGGGLYFRRNDGSGWSDYLLLESTGRWPTMTQAADGRAWMMWEDAGSLKIRHYDGATWAAAETILTATGLNKGFYPNFKLDTVGERLEWTYTHCSGAPFSVKYGGLDLGTPPPPPPPDPPAAPTNLTATTLSDTEIQLGWTDNSGDETGFRIERSPDGTSGWSQIAEVGADVTSYTESGLAASTTYYYRAYAYNANGNSDYSNVASATTQDPPPTPPAAPSNLSAQAQSESEIQLAWTDNSGDETGFRIERSPDGIGSWVQIAETGANATSYLDSGLSASTTYYYRAYAYNAGGDSGYSNVASATTQDPPPTPPAAPSNLSAQAQSESQIQLAWTDNSGDETGFRIERSPDGNTGWVQVAEVGADVTSHTDTGLSASTTYYYRAYAFNAGGDSDYSNVASATTLEAPTIVEIHANGETTVAGTRSGDYTRTFANDGSDETITEIESGGRPANRYSYLEHRWTFDAQPGSLTTFYANAWGSASGDGDAFRMEYSLDGSQWVEMFTLASGSDPGIDQTFTLPGPLSGTVWVRVVDTDRTPGQRSLDTVFVDYLAIRAESAPGDPPAAPSGLAATAVSSSQIDLTWADNSGDELGFHVERSQDGNNWGTVADLPAGSTAFSDTGLQAETLYYYRVLAYNASGSSAPSNTASATTPPASQVEIHVGDLDGSSAPGKTGRWDATVTITVHDAAHNPVPGAAVSGAWSAGASGSGTCTTNSTGVCSLTKAGIRNTNSSVTFSVTGASMEGAVYASGQNHDPDGDSDGSTITIFQ